MECTSHHQLYRSLLSTARHLDEQKSWESLSQLLGEDVKQKRLSIVRKCEYLIYQDDETVSPKARVLLWRKGFYEPIAMAKRLVRSKIPTLEEMKSLEEFILSAIERLKVIFITVERRFDLDLKFLIDLGIFGCADVKTDVEKSENLSVASRSYALDTIHALAISLGDLHRYYLDFSFPNALGTAEEAAAFYFEAFKLNPKVGMPQNQLGTLLTDKNHHLDAVYHYFYALVCSVPFDPSEENVAKILLENANYLEHLDMEQEDYEMTVKDFLARFILVADIFFYDKEVADFSGLCHALLIDLKSMLEKRRTVLTSDMLYKMTAIMFFCMAKLQRVNSEKVHHLNAFLLAICAQMIASCIQQVEEFAGHREEQNSQFKEAYLHRYEAYDKRVREARKERQKVQDRMPKTPSASSYSDRNSLSVGGGSSQMEKGVQQTTKDARKVKSTKMRRRRKRRQSSVSSESDLTSNFDSESESSDVSSVLSDTDDEEEQETNASVVEKEIFNDFSMINLNGLTFSDVQIPTDGEDDDVVIEEETIMFPGNQPEVDVEIDREEEPSSEPPKKMKFKQKFHKIDPNIIVEFAQTEITLQALKLLFEWLRNNREIVISCQQTNPEFIHQTMALLNYFNIDIFTSKVFFERQMLHVAEVREDLRGLFDERLHIPIREDMALKHFSLFAANQEHLDWEMSAKLAISTCEENILRLFKMLDFGFYICKTFKFNYVFCTKARVFVENFLAKKKKRPKRAKTKNHDSRVRISRPSDASEEDGDSSGGRRNPKKGYLRNRNGDSVINVPDNEKNSKKIEDGDKNEKYALMGKLWLRSEVKSLESKIKKPNGLHLTPYLMMDSKSLTEFQATVKSLVKARKFVVLIPNAVLSELDELKKHSDGARNVIRWLEHEFSKGNRFLRSQRDHEIRPLPLLKIPKKIDREASVFLQIAQFCNYIVTNQMNPDGSTDVVTLLTGENLMEKKCPHFSFYGILNSIPVKFDQIQGFYAKYRKK
ncbi:nonsense-mediated mRNA decay factor SMG5 [Phlebotomus argentipes]|uniref:nonsense-mediated mRNA decay factor SMG5 n=1 Tax=Phlebotomus argentipes TaxID=94469 RepID=UPI002892DCEF|nr:nonsense-mediated mRNA decay factor SMG5 [Phlebotomus argentipes]